MDKEGRSRVSWVGLSTGRRTARQNQWFVNPSRFINTSKSPFCDSTLRRTARQNQWFVNPSRFINIRFVIRPFAEPLGKINVLQYIPQYIINNKIIVILLEICYEITLSRNTSTFLKINHLIIIYTFMLVTNYCIQITI